MLPVYNKLLIPCITKVTPSCSIFLPEFRRRSRVHQNAFANVFGIHYSISPIKNMLKQQELTYTYCFISFSMKFRSFSNEQQQKKKLKRIHEASKKCTNITKMERHTYILIEIRSLFFSKRLCCASFQRFFDGLSVSRKVRRSYPEMGST